MTPTFEMAVFASGEGTNFESIAKYFASKPQYSLTLYGHREECGAYVRAQKLNVPIVKFKPTELSGRLLDELKQRDTQLVVLAGFILHLPAAIHQNYHCLNIHPSLLPKYGGKGMYGNKVHEQVLQHLDRETGITIHRVNDEYDKGQILFQSSTALDHPNETIESIASKVHQLEYRHYPEFIESYIQTYL